MQFEVKGKQRENLLTDHVIIEVDNLKKQQWALATNSSYCKVTGHKVDIQKPTAVSKWNPELKPRYYGVFFSTM